MRDRQGRRARRKEEGGQEGRKKEGKKEDKKESKKESEKESRMESRMERQEGRQEKGKGRKGRKRSSYFIYCVHRREKQPLGCFDSRAFYKVGYRLTDLQG